MAASGGSRYSDISDVFDEIMNDSDSDIISDGSDRDETYEPQIKDADSDEDEESDEGEADDNVEKDHEEVVVGAQGDHADARARPGLRRRRRRNQHAARGGSPFIWTEPTLGPKNIREFNENDAGINTNLFPPKISIMGSFQAYYDNEFFRLVKTETNRYARQNLTEADRKHWKPVTLEDLKKVFAIVIHMCVVKKPSVNAYFSTRPCLHSTFPKRVGIGRDKYKRIMRYLHLNNNDNYIPRGQPNHDPLFKVKPLVELLLKRFHDLYTPSSKLTIDEAICPFRGHINFKVYIKNKPNKYGMRIECVCESSTGIVVHIEIYTATGDNSVEALLSRVLAPFENKNYQVFMDRRYSSPLIFKKLLSLGFYPVGTVQKNRKYLPLEFKTSKLKKGERVVRECDGILATKWNEVRDVYMLSTVDEDVMIDSSEGRAIHRNHQTLKPSSVISYNKNKAGVDRHDQMASYYPCTRKQLKWWKKMFWWLFEMGLVNSHKLYNLSNNSKLKFVSYLETLAEELPATLAEEVEGPPAAVGPGRYASGNHFPCRIPPTASKAKPTRRCYQCSNTTGPGGKKPRRETSWLCMECGVPLCIECFYPFHRPHARRN